MMKTSETIGKLAMAMAKSQALIKQPLKDKDNPFFKSKYVPLENVVDSIVPAISPNGLSFMQFPVNQENKVGVYTLVMHESGEWIQSEPIFATPTKQDPQGVGSTITYLKRYSLSAVFGITSDEDDDGNSISGINKPFENKINGATPKQLETIHSNVSRIAQLQSKDVSVVYFESLDAAGITRKADNELTGTEASKLVGYLFTVK